MTSNPAISHLPRLVLQKGKEEALKRKHPWIFSGAIAQAEPQIKDGDIVAVYNSKKEFEAIGHFTNGSIKVRILSYLPVAIDVAFWTDRLRNAYNIRKQLMLSNTNAYRLIHGEGDSLPGLVIDFYKGVAVFQAHSIGMHLAAADITEALKNVYGAELVGVYDKSKETLPNNYADKLANSYLYGNLELPHVVQENGKNFAINWEKGQKTGFFLDQRDNRDLLAHYAPGKSVLNAFCYSGGFSVYALAAGASRVHSIDISQKAMDLCDENVRLNPNAENHEGTTADVMNWLKTQEENYDIVVLDPPAFAKSLSARHRAVQGYKRLNIEGFKRVKSGGLLFTFSCSQVVDRELFYNTIVAAALESGRQVRVLHQLTQGADHPVNMFHPEGSYLKGLVLRVED